MLRIIVKDWFTSVKVCRVRPWRLNMSKSSCSSTVSVERDATVDPISARWQNNWFLYFEVSDILVRLNLSQFGKRGSPKPEFEFLDYFRDGGTFISSKMKPIIMGSKLYFVMAHPHDPLYTPRFDVYSFDPTDPKGPSFRLCRSVPVPSLVPPTPSRPSWGSPPSSRLPRESPPSVFQLEDKLYLLATVPKTIEDPSVKRSKLHPKPPFFQVFDFLHQSWKLLPHPFHKSLLDYYYLYKSFALKDKLYICSPADDYKSYTYDSYVLDTRQEKWKSAKNEILSRGFKAVAQLCKGFMIAIPDLDFQSSGQPKELVIYQLDDNGFPIPKPYQVLRELGEAIFSTFLPVRDCYMGECGGDGRMWLVYYGRVFLACEATFDFMRVAVFQVSISNILAGNPVFSANLEAAEFYSLQGPGGCAYNQPVPFVMCHESSVILHKHLHKDLGDAFKKIPHAH